MRAFAAVLSAFGMSLACGCSGDVAAAFPLATPAPSPPARPSTSGDIIWGVNGHPTTAYGAVTLDQQMATLARLGMTHYRVGSESLDKVEEMLTVAARYSVTLLPVITPDLQFDAHSASEIYRNSYRTAYTAALRFKGRVKVWELGNELEGYAIIKPCEIKDNGEVYSCAYGFGTGIDPLEYVGARWAKVSAALKGMSEGVHAADPDARRAAGSAGWGHTGSFERMKADGIQWEISVWHEYGDDPEWAMKILQTYGKPIWYTEFGATSFKVGEQAQADHIRALMQTIRRLKRYGIEAAFIYELLDESYWGENSEAENGLVHLVKDGQGRWVLGGDKIAAGVVKSSIAAGP